MVQTQSATGKELYGIQMLRAAAAIAVVTHHSLEQSNAAAGRFSPDWFTTLGASGVDIFFVISGFIMLHVSFRSAHEAISPASFLYKRATRIYPLYWLCCLAMIGAWAVGFMAHHHWGHDALVASFLLLPSNNPLINVSWTLIYEVYFYLIFAATLVYRSKFITAVATTGLVVVLGCAGFLLPAGAFKNFLTNPIALEFCFGLWLSWAFTWMAGRKPVWPLGITLGVAGVAMLALASIFVPHRDTSGLDGLARVLCWGLPAVLIVGAFLMVDRPRSAALRYAVILGEASYALYLTHVFVMITYAKLLIVTGIGRVDQLWVVPAVVILAAAIALATHVLIERPMLTGIRHMAKPRRTYSLRAS